MLPAAVTVLRGRHDHLLAQTTHPRNPHGSLVMLPSMRDPEDGEIMGSRGWDHLDESDPSVDPGFDFSVYDGVFLSIEQQIAAEDLLPAGLTRDELHAMAARYASGPPGEPHVAA